MFKLFITFFIFFLLIFSHYVNSSPSITETYYQVRQERLLGVEMKYALFEMIVDEPLYIFEGFWCRPLCKELPSDCGFCDYSTKEPCSDKELQESYKSLNCTCDQIQNQCNEKKDGDWISLKEGRQGPFSVGDNNGQFFRFFFDRPCNGWRVSVIEHYGFVSLATNMVPFTGRQGLPQLLSTSGEVSICPNDFLNYFGTYEVLIEGRPPQAAKFDLVLQFKDFGSEEEKLEEPKKCSSDPYGSYCLELGQSTGPFNVPIYNFIYLRWTITSCQYFVFLSDILWSEENHSGGQGFIFGFDQIIPLPTEYYIGSRHQLIFGMCPSEGKEKSYFYILSLNTEVSNKFTINLISNPGGVNKRKMSEIYTSTYATRLIQGSYDIQCGTKVYECRRGAIDWGNSCLEGFNSVPTLDSPTALWPRPRYLVNIDSETFSSLPYQDNYKLEDQKVIGGLFLETTIGSTRTVVISNWENTNYIQQNCTVNFLPYSVMFNIDGHILTGKHSPKFKEMECDMNKFENISVQIDSLIDSMSLQNDSVSVLATRYFIDSLTFSEPWQGCDLFIQSFLEKKQQKEEHINTESCPPSLLNSEEYEDDACCNPILSWEMCCIPRNITDQVQVYQIKPDLSDEQMCGDSECLETMLDEYRFYSNLRNSISGCSTAIGESLSSKQYKSLEFFRQCKSLIFGDDGKGKNCNSDNDCENSCHSINKICVYQNDEELEHAYQSFFDCLEETMPSSVREFLKTKYDLSDQQSNNLSNFLNSIYRVTDCVTWLGRSKWSDRTEKIPSALTACLGCDSWCFDLSCITPLRCELNIDYGRKGNVCSYSQLSFPSSQSDCENRKVCNWNNSGISNQSECIQSNSNDNSVDTNTYCAVCETPTSCTIVNSTECQGNVCVVGKDIYFGLSKEQCSQKGYCSLLDCDDCDTKQKCESNGWCSDIEVIHYLKETTTLTAVSSKGFIPPNDGYCTRALNPWNDVDCAKSTDTTADYPLYNACLLVLNETNCKKNSKYEWNTLSTNKEECERDKVCDEPGILTDMKSLKDQEQCSLCNGDYIPNWKWTNGVWYTGEIRKLEEITKEWTNEHRWNTTIDFKTLSEHIMESNTEQYSLELQTEAQCRLNPVKTVMEKIVCFCETSNNENCLNQTQTLEIGIGKVCQNELYSLIAPPSILYFEEDSVKSGCIDIRVATLLKSEIQTPKTQTISTTFLKRSEGKDNVKNEKGEFVGELLGDGIEIIIKTEQRELLQNFTICISFVDQIKTTSSYPVIDFGYRIEENEVRPLSLSAYLMDRYSLCSHINQNTYNNIVNNNNNNNNIYNNNGIEFYPIIRKSDWKKESNGLSSGEKGVYGLMFALYLVCLLIKFVDEIHEGSKLFIPKRWISLCLMICLFVRLIYFGELLSEDLSENSDSLTEFLLIEIPTYFYFLALTLTGLLWYSLSIGLNSEEVVKKVGMNWFICFIFTVSFALIVVIIWNTNSEDGSYRCDGRVYEEPDTTNQDAIRLLYRIVISLASVVICCIITYYGNSISSTLRKTQMKSSSTNVYFLQKIYYVNIVSTLSLVSQNIFFILYSELADPSYEWLLFLILIELIPIISIFIILRKEHPKKSSSGSTGSSSGTGTGAGNGTGVGVSSSKPNTTTQTHSATDTL